jgi:hypothetical protein
VIRAEVHTDDHKLEIPFDATPWFEQATRTEILALRKCGWGGDYPADDVAHWFAGTLEHPMFVKLFSYLEIVNDQGFECHVDADDALEWLRQNQTSLWLCIKTSEEVS